MIELMLNGLDVDCVIGDRPEERLKEQRLTVDVVLTVDDAATETDALCDTVDYAALADGICAALVAAKCRMIERAAKVVADECLRHPCVAKAVVTVTKAGAVARLRSASVRLTAE